MQEITLRKASSGSTPEVSIRIGPDTVSSAGGPENAEAFRVDSDMLFSVLFSSLPGGTITHLILRLLEHEGNDRAILDALDLYRQRVAMLEAACKSR